MTTFATDLFVPTTLAFGIPGGWEWIVLLIIGLLIFGRRLPEVGKWLGQGIVEFKRGIKGIDEEIEQESSRRPARLEDRETKPSPSEKVERETSAEGLQPPR